MKNTFMHCHMIDIAYKHSLSHFISFGVRKRLHGFSTEKVCQSRAEYPVWFFTSPQGTFAHGCMAARIIAYRSNEIVQCNYVFTGFHPHVHDCKLTGA